MSGQMLKDAFVSYNRADEIWAKNLAERIEQEPPDLASGGKTLSVFYAPWDIEYGQNIVNRINEGLRSARFFLVVMSPEFFESSWTNFEWTDQVAGDPTNATGRIVPLLYRDVSLDGKNRISFPSPFTVLNRLDFRKEDKYDQSLQELIRVLRGQPKIRGSAAAITSAQVPGQDISASRHEYALPSATEELLISNLVKITEKPSLIWSGDTAFRKKADVWEAVETEEQFLLKDGRIYTFSNLKDSNCSLRKAVNVETIKSPITWHDWMKDEEGRRRYVELLNLCLKQHLRKRKIGKDEKGRFFFWTDRNEEGVNVTREFALPGDKSREVASRKVNPNDGSTFWVHYAAEIRVEIIGDDFFFLIEPTYIFTKDGRQALDGKSMGRLSVQWSGKQQNPDVLRAVLFWTKVLSDGTKSIKIAAGVSWIMAGFVPAIARTNFGVGGDYIRVQALMQMPPESLDDVASEVNVFERDVDDENDVEENTDEDQF